MHSTDPGREHHVLQRPQCRQRRAGEIILDHEVVNEQITSRTRGLQIYKVVRTSAMMIFFWRHQIQASCIPRTLSSRPLPCHDLRLTMTSTYDGTRNHSSQSSLPVGCSKHGPQHSNGSRTYDMRTPSLLAGNSLVTALPPTKFTRSTTSAFSGSAKKSSPA